LVCPGLKSAQSGSGLRITVRAHPIAEDSDGFSSPSQLLEDLLRLLGIVGHYRELDETIGDACHIDRFEVDAGVAQPARNVGDDSGSVLEQDEVHLTLREPNVP